MNIDLKAIGITEADLVDRVVDQLVHNILYSRGSDDEGKEFRFASTTKKELDARIVSLINEKVTAIADEHIKPNVNAMIEGIVIQKTNQYGEKDGKPVTFIEYLVGRAERYMVEEVNSEGKSKAESGDSYNWRKAGTRVAMMLDKHLHYSISTAMEQALKSANSQIATGIAETVKIKLNEIVGRIKTDVKV